MSVGGLSKERLARVGEVMGGYVERDEVPGVVTLIARGGEVHAGAAGTMAAGGSDPIRRDTLFRVTSMTKPVTAVAAMILVEECRLRLDEPVDRLLPELSGRRVLRRLDGPVEDTVPATRPITVRDLLTFTMGFGAILAPPGTYPIQKASEKLSLAPPDPPTSDEWIRRLGTLPLMHQPGEKWMYSTSADVLGVLIARASGQPFETFLRERLFEPLDMTDTSFAVPAVKLGRLAAAYWPDPATGALAPDDSHQGRWSRPPAFPSGAGDPQAGLISTVDDYLAFAQMLQAGGIHRGQRILSRPSVETMTTDQLTPAQKAVSGFWPGYFDSRGWGFGLSVVTRRDHPAAPVGTFGWDGGWGTIWRSDPHEDMITILMTQVAWTSPNPPNICLDFWTTAYRAIDD
ncbi:serine hydrolase domain-containing protein [Micromonospora sp. NPDC005806]|uniref:serine hydrolase domain-containing protein n=1 Tax=Micromonospora sp. NPDC005806 TaxID=3364234 RepID=UPI0036AD9C3C